MLFHEVTQRLNDWQVLIAMSIPEEFKDNKYAHYIAVLGVWTLNKFDRMVHERYGVCVLLEGDKIITISLCCERREHSRMCKLEETKVKVALLFCVFSS